MATFQLFFQGLDPENRVGDQNTVSPGRPVSSGLQVPGGPGHCRTRTTPRGGVRGMRGLGPTMTARGQSIGISIGVLPQTLIMSRLDKLSRLGARV
jgi:hypothetical protein